MKRLMILLMLVGFGTKVLAEEINVADTLIKVPQPQDFIKVTEQMEGATRLSEYMGDQVNDLMAFYIPSTLEAEALAGEVPQLSRYFLLKVNKQIKNAIVGKDDFATLKAATKKQNQSQFDAIMSNLDETMGAKSEQISDDFDVDFAMKIAQVVPMDIHYEVENGFAYSTYLKMDTNVEGSAEQAVMAITTSFVNVSGKVLFLYSYGAREDLQWTRDASIAWMSAVLAANDAPPAESKGAGINWDSVMNSAVIGGLIGAAFSLFFFISGRLKKKKQPSED